MVHQNVQGSTGPDGMTRRDAVLAILAGAGAGAAGCAPTRHDLSSVERSTLKAVVRGDVISRAESGYESTRRSMSWNALAPDRRPDAIVRVTTVEDVQAAVKFARNEKLRVAVRTGGHSWCGSSLRDGGLLLDLSLFDSLRVNPGTSTIMAGPAAKGSAVAAALEPHGLAFPVGHCPSVPLGGFLLAGGFGWNTGAWGPACQSVISMGMVDARGERLRASDTENAELFWAARGAGPGFFGVVTDFELRAQRLPRAIRSKTLVFQLDDLPRIGRWLSESVAKLPPQVEVTCLLAGAPPGLPPGFIVKDGRALIVLAIAFADGDTEAAEWLGPLDAIPAGLRHTASPLAPETFASLHAALARAYPEGRRYAADVTWCAASATEVLLKMRETVLSAPTPESFGMVVLPAPPAPGAPPPPDMALSMFAPVIAATYAVWREPDADGTCRDWVKGSSARLAPITAGHYIGETDLAAGPDRARRSFAEKNWERLAALKARHDPDGLFHTFLDAR